MRTTLSRNLAQINIARMKAPLDHPVMKGFVELLDRINALADDSPGFIWRLQTEDGDAIPVRVFDDPLILVNLSLWKNVEALREYVYRSDHLIPFRQRRAWFDATPEPHMALWWVPTEHRPTAEEGRDRLDRLGRIGPTAQAFAFARPFTPAGEALPRSPGHDRL